MGRSAAQIAAQKKASQASAAKRRKTTSGDKLSNQMESKAEFAARKRFDRSRREPAAYRGMAAANERLAKPQVAMKQPSSLTGTKVKSGLPSMGNAADAKARAFKRKPKGASAQNAGSRAASAARKKRKGM